MTGRPTTKGLSELPQNRRLPHLPPSTLRRRHQFRHVPEQVIDSGINLTVGPGAYHSCLHVGTETGRINYALLDEHIRTVERLSKTASDPLDSLDREAKGEVA